MKIMVPVTVKAIKRGMAARAISPALTGHGEDRDEALASLEKAALAWAFSLQRAERLDKAIARNGLHADPIRPDDIHIELVVAVDRKAGQGQDGSLRA